MELFKIITILTILSVATPSTFIQLFGMGYLLKDLAKISTTTLADGKNSTSYTLNTNLIDFLSKFKSRTQFCTYKCQQFYNLPCFLLFGCNVHLRNFFLIIIAPIIFLITLALCCSKGVWTFGCWARYITLFSGISLIIWVINSFTIGNQVVKRRKNLKQKLQTGRSIIIKDQIEYPNDKNSQ